MQQGINWAKPAPHEAARKDSAVKNLNKLCKMVTQPPEPIPVGVSQKRVDSMPFTNCLGKWNRMVPHYRNIINCSSIFYHVKVNPLLCKGSQQVSNLHYDRNPPVNRK